MMVFLIYYGIFELVPFWVGSRFDAPSIRGLAVMLPAIVMIRAAAVYGYSRIFRAHVANIFCGNRSKSQSAAHEFKFAQAMCFGPLLQPRSGGSEQLIPIAASRSEEGQGHV
jgi:hypothetical protein